MKVMLHFITLTHCDTLFTYVRNLVKLGRLTDYEMKIITNAIFSEKYLATIRRNKV